MNDLKKLIGVSTSNMTEIGVCFHCGLSNHRFLKSQKLRCMYHDFPSLNYRGATVGQCALRLEDLIRIYHDAKPRIARKIAALGLF